MKQWRVTDVMTADVVTVTVDVGYKTIADLLVQRSISAVPVLDSDARVCGIVSEIDLLAKLEYADQPSRHPLFSRRIRAGIHKAAGDTAGELMTSPAITISSAATVTDAARRMDSAGVKRLPVIDDAGHLVGIVSRRDLVGLYTRSDDDLRAAVVEAIASLWIDEASVDPQVKQGVLRLRGRVDRRTSSELIEMFSRATPGVVDVVNELAYDRDDGTLEGTHGTRHPR